MRWSPPAWLSKHPAELYRIGAAVCFAAYLVALLWSHASTRRPGSLGIRVEPCDAGVCIAWVMPASHAWFDGARPGMVVVTADGAPVGRGDLERVRRASEATARTDDGDDRTLSAVVPADPASWRSLWLLGGVFAVLGALVVLRRGDLASARSFGRFAAAGSIALAVAPAAEGPHAAWALAAQLGSLVAFGATSFGFALSLVGPDGSTGAWRQAGRAVNAAGGVVVAVYALTVATGLPPYSAVRVAAAVYIASTIVAAIATLGALAVRPGTGAIRLQAGICMAGIALGALPFIVLTLIPVMLVQRTVVPTALSVLPIGIMPAAFAFAITQYGMLGIRKLIHRGMVYATASLLLLGTLSLLLAALGPDLTGQPLVLAGLFALAVVSFFPLRSGAYWLIDRLAYRDEIDHAKIIGAVHGDIVGAEEHQDAVRVLMQRIADALNLEAAVLYLGDDPDAVRPVTAVGERHDDVTGRFRPPGAAELHDARGTELLSILWESNTLLLSPLLLSGRFLGCVVWGPKPEGDVFVDSEKHLIATMTPILTLVIQERSLSDQRRDLNEQLLRSSEVERARLASDLHDGPLQKAILLSGPTDTIPVAPWELARELVQELREVCTRLRPAILDDLGLISALDWLVHEVPRRSTLRSRLHLQDLDETERFSADTELALFRVTQEAINNAIKHSGASTIDVDLGRNNGHLVLRVWDDGTGFSAATQGSGLGLAGMRERVRHLNGAIAIHSETNEGTEVTVSVPIVAEEAAP